MGICSLTLADWPEASVTALFCFFIDFLSTVFVPLGRGKSFPAASLWVWVPCTHPVAGSCPAPTSCLSRAWSTWQVGLPAHPLAAASLAGLNCRQDPIGHPMLAGNLRMSVTFLVHSSRSFFN